MRRRVSHEATKDHAPHKNTSKHRKIVSYVHSHNSNHTILTVSITLWHLSIEHLQKIPNPRQNDIHGRQQNRLPRPPWPPRTRFRFNSIWIISGTPLPPLKCRQYLDDVEANG